MVINVPLSRGGLNLILPILSTYFPDPSLPFLDLSSWSRPKIPRLGAAGEGGIVSPLAACSVAAAMALGSAGAYGIPLASAVAPLALAAGAGHGAARGGRRRDARDIRRNARGGEHGEVGGADGRGERSDLALQRSDERC